MRDAAHGYQMVKELFWQGPYSQTFQYLLKNEGDHLIVVELVVDESGKLEEHMWTLCYVTGKNTCPYYCKSNYDDYCFNSSSGENTKAAVVCELSAFYEIVRDRFLEESILLLKMEDI